MHPTIALEPISRTDVFAKIINSLGLGLVMFEAVDSYMFRWYLKNYGPEVDLFIDHSQIVQVEMLRRGIWGTKSLWGRIVTFKEEVPFKVRRMVK